MDDILQETISPDDLKKFECVYHEQLKNGTVTDQATFEYAWCLVRSKYTADIRKGILLLQNLFDKSEEQRRDCLYYLAIGNARIKEYNQALHFVRLFLQAEPGNQQVQALETIIQRRLRKEGLTGAAIAGGVMAGLAIGALGLVMATRKGGH